MHSWAQGIGFRLCPLFFFSGTIRTGRERDTVELYMTYTMAYGDEMIGVVPYRSPVAWFVSIDKVEKTD